MHISISPSDNEKERSSQEKNDEGCLSGRGSDDKFCDALDAINNWTFDNNDSLVYTEYENEPVLTKTKKEDTDYIENWTFNQTDSDDDNGFEVDPEIVKEERKSKHKNC
jgi:hypothetical protein